MRAANPEQMKCALSRAHPRHLCFSIDKDLHGRRLSGKVNRGIGALTEITSRISPDMSPSRLFSAISGLRVDDRLEDSAKNEFCPEWRPTGQNSAGGRGGSTCPGASSLSAGIFGAKAFWRCPLPQDLNNRRDTGSKKKLRKTLKTVNILADEWVIPVFSLRDPAGSTGLKWKRSSE